MNITTLNTTLNRRLLAIIALMLLMLFYTTPVLAYIGLGDVTGTGAGYNEEKLIASGTIASLFISDDGGGPLVVGPYGAGGPPAPAAPAADPGITLLDTILLVAVGCAILVIVLKATGNPLYAFAAAVIGMMCFVILESLLALL